MGSINSTKCNFFCTECLLTGKNLKICASAHKPDHERNLSKLELVKRENICSEHNSEKNKLQKEEKCDHIKKAINKTIDDSTLPNLENTKEFKNNTFSEKNLTFDCCFNSHSKNNFKFNTEENNSKTNNEFQSKCKNQKEINKNNPTNENMFLDNSSNKNENEIALENLIKNLNTLISKKESSSNSLANNNSNLTASEIILTSDKLKTKSDQKCNLSDNNPEKSSFCAKNELQNKTNTFLSPSLKEKLYLDLKNLNFTKPSTNQLNYLNNNNSKSNPNYNNNYNNNYLESDRSNRSNYLMISIGEYKDGLENISNIRVGKSFTNLIKEFNSIIKIYFSNLQINKKFEINLISEEREKENYSINSNKISDYNSVSGYSASNFSMNELNSNLNSFAKSGFYLEKNDLLCSRKNSKKTETNNYLNKQSLYVSDFSSDKDKNLTRKNAKKTFTLLKNLIYIPICSISGEIKNSFTLKKIINYKQSQGETAQMGFEEEEACTDKITMSEISIKTPYFDNLYSFFLNFLENCRVEKTNVKSDSKSKSREINKSSIIDKDANKSCIKSSISNPHNHERTEKSKNISYSNYRNKCDDSYNDSSKSNAEIEDENQKIFDSNIREILLKEKERLESLELSRIKERLELYFKIMKQFSMLETKANLNPNKNSFYISFLNLIRMADIQILIQKLNFPNQEKFFGLIKAHNLYFEELKLNAKKDQIKIVIAQFQKSNNHSLKNFQNKIAHLLQIISTMSEALVNKQIPINKIKKLIYEKENRLLSQSESHNMQIYFKFNLEQNLISQIGFLKERNFCSFDFDFLVKREEDGKPYKNNVAKGFDAFNNIERRNRITKADYKNYKLKRECFVFDFYQSEEQYLEYLKENEGCGNNKELLKAKSEFECMLVVKEGMKILREYEIA